MFHFTLFRSKMYPKLLREVEQSPPPALPDQRDLPKRQKISENYFLRTQMIMNPAHRRQLMVIRCQPLPVTTMKEVLPPHQQKDQQGKKIP